jgi:hypothetical protein
MQRRANPGSVQRFLDALADLIAENIRRDLGQAPLTETDDAPREPEEQAMPEVEVVPGAHPERGDS